MVVDLRRSASLFFSFSKFFLCGFSVPLFISARFHLYLQAKSQRSVCKVTFTSPTLARQASRSWPVSTFFFELGFPCKIKPFKLEDTFSHDDSQLEEDALPFHLRDSQKRSLARKTFACSIEAIPPVISSYDTLSAVFTTTTRQFLEGAIIATKQHSAFLRFH